MDDLTSYSASKARENFYDLLRKAATGKDSFEINLRGQKPVVLISKEELEGWLETLDIMSSPKEVKAIEEGRKDKTRIPFEKVLKELGFNEKDFVQKTSRKRSQRV